MRTPAQETLRANRYDACFALLLFSGELDATGRRARQAEEELARVTKQLADMKSAHAASEQEKAQLKDEVDGLSVAARVAEREAADARQRVEATLHKARADAAVLQLPPSWSASATASGGGVTVRVADGAERDGKLTAFTRTLPGSVNVVELERVQNVSMWRSYAVKRQSVLLREGTTDASRCAQR